MTKWDEYIKYYAERNIVYEIMFFLFCLVAVYSTRGISKALFCFLDVMIGGSVIDKALFKITYYIYTDLILIVIATCTAFIIYNHDGRVERT